MYTMRISRMTVDKLGVRLYDRVSAVIAELVSNSYDADATRVIVSAPMGEFLASKHGSTLTDKGFTIEVSDNGIGMTPEEINEFYLKVGAERRNDSRRGDVSKVFERKVMGRKGVGKLAPFGICKKIEIISSGGEMVDGLDATGKQSRGFLTAHLTLDHQTIMSDDDSDYKPEIGNLDQTVSSGKGTTIKMTVFEHRRVPDIEDFERQLAQRFGLQTADWSIILRDSNKSSGDGDFERTVGEFEVNKMPGTEIKFVRIPVGDNEYKYEARDPNDNIYSDIEAYIEYDGVKHPITGWMAYSTVPYKDDLMAGVRIYCRGKIAAQTQLFNRKAGFTGEHTIRSYLIGELHADFLDLEEDLIQTDRTNILWSHELGQAFEKWGQYVVQKIGKLSRVPMKIKVWDRFQEISNFEEKIIKAFPSQNQADIRSKAKDLIKLFGQSIREDELDDIDHIDRVVQLGVVFAPHIILDDKLRQAAAEQDTSLGILTGLLKTARIAELSSFGRIADDRIKVIDKIEQLKDDPGTLEAAFQDLITQAPWLIDPQWAPITANVTFTTVRDEFSKYYLQKTRESIVLNNFSDPNKRMDFVFSTQDNNIQIIEIKRPHHAIRDDEFSRLLKYKEQMEQFLDEPNHTKFKQLFSGFHITLVADDLSLSYAMKNLFDLMIKSGVLTFIDWTSFLLNTKRMHQDFIIEAERQKQNASTS